MKPRTPLWLLPFFEQFVLLGRLKFVRFRGNGDFVSESDRRLCLWMSAEIIQSTLVTFVNFRVIYDIVNEQFTIL